MTKPFVPSVVSGDDLEKNILSDCLQEAYDNFYESIKDILDKSTGKASTVLLEFVTDSAAMIEDICNDFPYLEDSKGPNYDVLIRLQVREYSKHLKTFFNLANDLLD